METSNKRSCSKVEQVEGGKEAQYEFDGIGQLEDAKAVEREQAVQLDQGKWENW